MAVDHDRRSSGLRAFDRGTLSLFSSNAHKLTKPIAAEPNFNMPPVRQIGELDPFAVVPKSTPLESAPIAPAQAQTTTDVALRQPADVSGPLSNASADAAETASPVDLRPGRIGKSAVNVRSGPSKTNAKLGVLSAGAEVGIGETDGGWVHVWHAGGDGWVYSDYLAGSAKATATITVRGGRDSAKPAAKGVEVGSRMTARERPDAGATPTFRLKPGDR